MILHTRYVSIITDRGIRRGQWSLNILVGYRKPPFNKGAGYIGGATFYLAHNAVSRKNMYVPQKGLQIGLTRNANKVPWLQH